LIDIQQVSSGHVVSLVSSDVRRFSDAFFYWPFAIIGPLEMMMVGSEASEL
jgi:hypothetical protein